MITKYIQNKVEQKPIRTGLASFDYVTGGLKIGHTYEIRGSDDCGTSELALNISKSLVCKKWKLLYFDVRGQLHRAMISRYGFPYDNKEDRYSFSTQNKPNEIREFCLKNLNPDKKNLVVLDSLLSMLYEIILPGDAINSNNFLREQLNLRAILADIALAIKKAGGILLILNDQRVTQFEYVVQNRYRKMGIQSPFPMHLLGGIIKLDHHKLKKSCKNGYANQIKMTCQHYNQLGKSYTSDYIYMSPDKGFSNNSTIIRLAIDQGIIKKTIVNNQTIFYNASLIQDFPQTQNLYNLANLLENNKQLRAKVIKLIDWRKTIYGTQPENR